MTEKEYSPSVKDKKISSKKEEIKLSGDSQIKKDEKKPAIKEERKEEKKKPVVKKVEITPKEMAVARGHSMRLSLKHCMGICKMLKGMKLDKAVVFLDGVARGKIAVNMRGREVPHQKGPGVSGGKYPKKAALEIIGLIKQLEANANVNQVDEPVIVIAKADTSAMPWKKDRRKAKRCHVYLEARTKIKKEIKGDKK